MTVSVKDLRSSGRKSPWMVIFYQARKAVREFFPTREAANQKADDLKKIFRVGGNVEDYKEACRVAGASGYGVAHLVKMGLEYIKSKGATSVSPTVTFAQAAKMVIERAITKNRRNVTIEGYKSAYNLLNRTFGDKPIGSITDSEVAEYLHQRRDRNGRIGKASAHTTISIIKHLKNALRIVGIAKPLPTIFVPEVGDKEICFFSAEEVRMLFSAARPSERGALALLIFCALRPTIITRLSIDCIDVVGKKITIPKCLAKDGRRHVLHGIRQRSDGESVPVLPEIIWPWLEMFPYQPVKWSSFQIRLKKALGGKWIQDGTRHTGATFYCELFGETATSALLTHESKTMALDFYIGTTSNKEAQAFYSLAPSGFLETLEQPQSKKVVNWPSDEKLEAWLKTEPATRIAKALGCSDAAIWKRCQKRKIRKPGLGEWAKRAFGIPSPSFPEVGLQLPAPT